MTILNNPAARVPGAVDPICDLQCAGSRVHHPPDQRVGLRQPWGWRGMAISQHERAA